MRRKLSVFLLAVLTGLFSSCLSINHRMEIAALPAGLPVSGSPLIYWKDRIYHSEELKVVADFKVEKIVHIKFGQPGTSLDVSEDVKNLVQQYKGDGITDLVIRVKEIDSSQWDWTIADFFFGGLATGLGSAILVRNALPGQPFLNSPILSDQVKDFGQSVLVGSGLVFTGTGLGLLVLGLNSSSGGTINYRIALSGKVIKF